MVVAHQAAGGLSDGRAGGCAAHLHILLKLDLRAAPVFQCLLVVRLTSEDDVQVSDRLSRGSSIGWGLQQLESYC